MSLFSETLSQSVPMSRGGPRSAAILRFFARLRFLVGIPIVLLAWEFGARAGWVNGNLFPATTSVLRAMIDLAQAEAQIAERKMDVRPFFDMEPLKRAQREIAEGKLPDVKSIRVVAP